MPQIGDTRWYTARLVKGRQIPDSERSEIEIINGYRMKLGDWSDEEVKAHVDQLAADGIVGKIKTSRQDHTDIPAGEPFFQVSDKESIKRLEHLFKTMGIALNPDRFSIYDQAIANSRKRNR